MLKLHDLFAEKIFVSISGQVHRQVSSGVRNLSNNAKDDVMDQVNIQVKDHIVAHTYNQFDKDSNFYD